MKLPRVHPGAAFAVCLAIWGTTWIVIRRGIEDLPALGSAGLRTGIAALLLAAIALAIRAPRPTRRGIVGAALVGVFLFAGNLGLIYVAEKSLTSSATVVLYSTLPLQVALMAPFLVPGERFSPRRLGGALLGLVGVAVSIGGVASLGIASGAAALAAVLAATGAALGTSLGRRYREVDPFWMNAIGNGSATVVLVLASVLFENGSPIPRTSGGWLALAYLVLMGSIVAFVLYAQLLRSWAASRAVYVSIGAYALAIAIGVLFAGEPFTPQILAGSGLILLGAVLSVGRGAKPADPKFAPPATPERT